jgi:putative membrane protein
MRDTFYDHLPVSDGLAGERTFLANERTLLAYVRTAFALFVAGLTGTQLLEDRLLVVVGHVLSVLALLVFTIGIFRYRASRKATLRMLARLRDAAAKKTAQGPALRG